MNHCAAPQGRVARFPEKGGILEFCLSTAFPKVWRDQGRNVSVRVLWPILLSGGCFLVGAIRYSAKARRILSILKSKHRKVTHPCPCRSRIRPTKKYQRGSKLRTILRLPATSPRELVVWNKIVFVVYLLIQNSIISIQRRLMNIKASFVIIMPNR